MRTPNTKCEICGKPLYRRPSDLKRYNGVCCVGCRSELYKKRPPSPNLELGREKGTNHLEGIPKSKTSNLKRSKSHNKWCKENPNKVKSRGIKTRGENHYNWKGGISNLNQSIRQMNEYRNWQRKMKKRDVVCVNCGGVLLLEAHHIIPIKMLMKKYRIKNRDDARNCKELWSTKNGITLCQRCHYQLHGRKYGND